jgi:SNF2 family DNA or RNA helicase
MCASTIVVVPKNLLHQWQSEIRKHVAKGALKVLVMDTEPRRGSKSKSSKTKMEITEDIMDLRSEIPAPTELMAYDIVLFTKSRFEQEIQDGADEKDRRIPAGAPLSCNCPYIGATRTPDCTCLTKVYESPLKRVHWLRIIIDEGHSLSSGMSNAARVARQLKAERRWVVSGTPAKNLVGVELELLSEEQADGDPMLLRELASRGRGSASMMKTTRKLRKRWDLWQPIFFS